MRAHGLDHTLNLIDELSEVLVLVAGDFRAVDELEVAHSKSGRELQITFTDIAAGGGTAEGALGEQEADFIESGLPRRIDNELARAMIGNSRNKRLDKHREAIAVNRIEAQRAGVDTHTQATEERLEGVAPQRVLGISITAAHSSAEVSNRTGFVAEGIGLLATDNNTEVGFSARVELLDVIEVIAKLIRKGEQRLERHRGSRETASEVRSNLILATGQTAINGATSLRDVLEAGIDKELGAVIRDHDILNAVLEALNHEVIALLNRNASTLHAEDLRLTTGSLELRGELGGAHLGLRAYFTTYGRGVFKHRHSEGLAGIYTIRDEGFNGIASIRLNGAAKHHVGVRVVLGDVLDDFVTKLRNLVGNCRHGFSNGESLVREGHCN